MGHEENCRHDISFSRRVSPESCSSPPSRKSEGAGKAGLPLHRGPRAEKSCASAKTTGIDGDNRPSLRDGLIRALLGEPSRLPPSSAQCASIVANLAPDLGAPGPHDFAVRRRPPLVSQRLHVHRIPASSVVTTAIRPSVREAGWAQYAPNQKF